MPNRRRSEYDVFRHIKYDNLISPYITLSVLMEARYDLSEKN